MGIDVVGGKVGMLVSGLEVGRWVGRWVGPVGEGVGIGLHSSMLPQGLKPHTMHTLLKSLFAWISCETYVN